MRCKYCASEAPARHSCPQCGAPPTWDDRGVREETDRAIAKAEAAIRNQIECAQRSIAAHQFVDKEEKR